MFVRKGTTLRKKRQSVRRPRPSSSSVSQQDPEAGESTSISGQSLPNSRSVGSSASSTLTLDDEKTLVGGGGGGAESGGGRGSTQYQSISDRTYQHLQANYGSLVHQVKEAQEESIDLVDFLQRIFEIVWQSLILTVVLFLLLGVAVSMMVMGTSYLQECPVEPKLPIYLLVGGAFGLIHICIIIWQQKRSRDYMLLDDSQDDDDDEDGDGVMTRSYRFTGYVLVIFFIIWFVFGNYWLYSIWEPNFEQPLHEPRNWCSKSLYYYTFYLMIVWYSLFGLGFLLLVSCIITYWCTFRVQ